MESGTALDGDAAFRGRPCTPGGARRTPAAVMSAAGEPVPRRWAVGVRASSSQAGMGGDRPVVPQQAPL